MAKKYLLGLVFLFASMGAKADFYACDFTEPFFTVYVATDYKLVTVAHFERSRSFTAKIQSLTKSKGKVSLRFDDQYELVISLTKAGNDGMSDRYYPYDVQWKNKNGGQLWGGCESEKQNELNLVEQLATWRGQSGMSFVNYWPGEYGHVTGFKVNETVTFPQGTTWNQLSLNQKSKKPCTLNAGKEIVPAKATGFEQYAHLTLSLRFQSLTSDPLANIDTGDWVTLLAYLGEGYCLVENSHGQIKDTSCPGPEIKGPEEIKSEMNLPPFGDWFYASCSEGHMTWIHTDQIANHKKIESHFLGF